METAVQMNLSEESLRAKKERVMEQVLQEHSDADVKIVEEIVVDEANRSALYRVLKADIDAFLNYFLSAHSWKRLYVKSRLNLLSEDFDNCADDERRMKTMEFAAQMSRLVRETFPEGSDEYRRAMTGLGRIVELLFNWQANRLASDFPKYRGTKLDGNPIRFLRENYASWIASGRLTQVSLRDLDEKLLNAIKYELRKSNHSLADLIPPGIRR